MPDNYHEFEETKTLNQVAEFQRNFFAPVEPSPTLPAKDRQDLRVTLIKEELKELEDCVANGDLVGILDALADIQYVLSGAVLEFGFGKVFAAANSEVHSSNMSKLCSLEEAKATKGKYDSEHGLDKCYIIQAHSGKYVVLRGSDNKVIKNINYKPANFSQFVCTPSTH